MKKIYAYLLAVFSFLIIVFFKNSWDFLGFPDGHLTEYGHVMDKLYLVYIGIAGVFCLYFLYVAWFTGKRKLFVKPKIALLLLGVFLLISFGLDHYLALHLENGQGG